MIFITRSTLSDGSYVYAITTTQNQFGAITEKDAELFASKLADAIHDHTNGAAGIERNY